MVLHIFIRSINIHLLIESIECEDLVNCEAVCRQWRDILFAGTPWKRLFDRNKQKLSLWRRAQRTLEKNHVPTFRTDQYRDVCKEILQVKCNWRTGNFRKFTYLVDRPDCFRLTISDDYLAWDYWPKVEPRTFEGCAFLDTESMENERLIFGTPNLIGPSTKRMILVLVKYIPEVD
jgi:F-box-like